MQVYPANDISVIHRALGIGDDLRSAISYLWHMMKSFVRIKSVLIRTNSAKDRDL